MGFFLNILYITIFLLIQRISFFFVRASLFLPLKNFCLSNKLPFDEISSLSLCSYHCVSLLLTFFDTEVFIYAASPGMRDLSSQTWD